MARTASLTLTRSRFAFFAVALLTVKRNDRPVTIRVKVEDIGHELRSRSGSDAISASKYCEGRNHRRPTWVAWHPTKLMEVQNMKPRSSIPHAEVLQDLAGAVLLE